MLPPFIIDQIRKREEKEAQRDDRPVVEIPVPPLPPREHAPEDKDRGVVIIDLAG